tara:strand:+ start:2627 stop:2983 length:357 start_codon:yes stop_codon:yes gene_type:complete
MRKAKTGPVGGTLSNVTVSPLANLVAISYLYAASRLNVYVTLIVSPDTTDRSPGEEKSAAENRIPVVPLLVLLDVRNAPPMIVDALILKDAGDAVFVITEGSAVVAVPNVHACRVASE